MGLVAGVGIDFDPVQIERHCGSHALGFGQFTTGDQPEFAWVITAQRFGIGIAQKGDQGIAHRVDSEIGCHVP